jgi:hypothetical protein
MNDSLALEEILDVRSATLLLERTTMSGRRKIEEKKLEEAALEKPT